MEGESKRLNLKNMIITYFLITISYYLLTINYFLFH